MCFIISDINIVGAVILLQHIAAVQCGNFENDNIHNGLYNSLYNI